MATPLRPSCNESNGAFTAQANGGVAPYEFSLNGGTYQSTGRFSNLASGNYTVGVRDANNCTNTRSVDLQSEASPRASVANVRQPTCAGNNGQIQVQAQGGLAPYTYAINGGSFQSNATFSGLRPGNYTLSVQDSRGCQTTLQTNLSSASGNLVPATIGGTANRFACLLENVRLQGNLPGGTTGRWSLSNNLGSLSNAQSAQTNFRPQQAGTVEITWTLSTPGCSNYSQAKIQFQRSSSSTGQRLYRH
nr:hypothetical protein [Haliscomenobacter sp.]